MVEPPLLEGALQETEDWWAVSDTPDTPEGAPGAVWRATVGVEELTEEVRERESWA
jgi:hypothetical protein